MPHFFVAVQNLHNVSLSDVTQVVCEELMLIV